MKTLFPLASVLLTVALQAAPPLPDQLELRNTIQFAADAGIEANSMFNPRYFDGDVQGSDPFFVSATHRPAQRLWGDPRLGRS